MQKHLCKLTRAVE